MIHSEVKTALENTGVPVALHKYTGTATTFIVFHQYDEAGYAYAENQEQATSFHYEVSIVTKGSTKDLESSVKTELKKIGGSRIYAIDIQDGDYYQRTMRFVFTKFQ